MSSELLINVSKPYNKTLVNNKVNYNLVFYKGNLFNMNF